jgi:hypothetical protein
MKLKLTNFRIKAIISFSLILISNILLLSQTQEWIVYNTSNSGLPDNDVRAIAIDGRGTNGLDHILEGL